MVRRRKMNHGVSRYACIALALTAVAASSCDKEKDKAKAPVTVPAPKEPELPGIMTPIPLSARTPALQLGTGTESFQLLEDGAEVTMRAKLGGFKIKGYELMMAVRARDINPEHARVRIAYHEAAPPQKPL